MDLVFELKTQYAASGLCNIVKNHVIIVVKVLDAVNLLDRYKAALPLVLRQIEVVPKA